MADLSSNGIRQPKLRGPNCQLGLPLVDRHLGQAALDCSLLAVQVVTDLIEISAIPARARRKPSSFWSGALNKVPIPRRFAIRSGDLTLKLFQTSG